MQQFSSSHLEIVFHLFAFEFDSGMIEKGVQTCHTRSLRNRSDALALDINVTLSLLDRCCQSYHICQLFISMGTTSAIYGMLSDCQAWRHCTASRCTATQWRRLGHTDSMSCGPFLNYNISTSAQWQNRTARRPVHGASCTNHNAEEKPRTVGKKLEDALL